MVCSVSTLAACSMIDLYCSYMRRTSAARLLGSHRTLPAPTVLPAIYTCTYSWGLLTLTRMYTLDPSITRVRENTRERCEYISHPWKGAYSPSRPNRLTVIIISSSSVPIAHYLHTTCTLPTVPSGLLPAHCTNRGLLPAHYLPATAPTVPSGLFTPSLW